MDSDILPNYILDYWNLEKLTDSRPVAFYFYREGNLSSDDFDYEYYPHSVIEKTLDNKIFWYQMVDYETEDFWKIEPVIEDFDYEEEDE